MYFYALLSLYHYHHAGPKTFTCFIHTLYILSMGMAERPTYSRAKHIYLKLGQNRPHKYPSSALKRLTNDTPHIRLSIGWSIRAGSHLFVLNPFNGFWGIGEEDGGWTQLSMMAGRDKRGGVGLNKPVHTCSQWDLGLKNSLKAPNNTQMALISSVSGRIFTFTWPIYTKDFLRCKAFHRVYSTLMCCRVFHNQMKIRACVDFQKIMYPSSSQVRFEKMEVIQ